METQEALKTIRCVVRGRVQGVYYRASAKQEAETLGITGWIKNRSDDSVACSATGTDSQLKSFVEWLEHGPPDAFVERVDSESVELEPGSRFDIIR